MNSILQDFSSWAVKGVFGALMSIIAWFSMQLYGTMASIQKQFQEMDKRVSGIEISRSYYMERFLKTEAIILDVQSKVETLQQKQAVTRDALQRHNIY